MQTLQLYHALNRKLPVLYFSGALLFFACSKEDGTVPSGSSDANTLRSGVLLAPVSEVVKINHIPGHGLSPDYSVSLYSDHTAVFEGRRNVNYIGKLSMNVDENSYSYIINLFESSHFFQINDKIPVIIDAPQVLTTYTVNNWGLTLHDYDDGVPQILIQVRKRTEEKLNLSRYINS